ncbi:MAG: HD domain-containing protein [Clostridiales bacterium]|nr:HD domain-containing protein [Clostridiales bacterium]
MLDNNFYKRLLFLQETDKAKEVFRQNYLADGTRRENDAEHMWHFALTAMTLYPYAKKKVDLDRVIKMAILHDIIEVYSGDTYAYDEEAKKSQHAREMEACEKIFGLLPGDQGEEMKALFLEFEAMETDDALFAAACDRFQPFMLNLSSGGKSWLEHEVYADQIIERMQPIRTEMPEVFEYIETNIAEAKAKGLLK